MIPDDVRTMNLRITVTDSEYAELILAADPEPLIERLAELAADTTRELLRRSRNAVPA